MFSHALAMGCRKMPPVYSFFKQEFSVKLSKQLLMTDSSSMQRVNITTQLAAARQLPRPLQAHLIAPNPPSRAGPCLMGDVAALSAWTARESVSSSSCLQGVFTLSLLKK